MMLRKIKRFTPSRKIIFPEGNSMEYIAIYPDSHAINYLLYLTTFLITRKWSFNSFSTLKKQKHRERLNLHVNIYGFFHKIRSFKAEFVF